MDASVLPPELLLEIFPLLPLKGLIIAQGVSRQWRRLVPLSYLLPARRALLKLYMTAIDSPTFLETRSLILPHLCPFDREAYVSELDEILGAYVSAGDEQNYQCILPDDFRLWLLEWPARAAIGRIWPGLGYGTFSETVGPSGYNGLVNFFARMPRVSILDSEGNIGNGVVTATHRKMLAIEVWWHSKSWSSWLVIDGARSELKGTVHGVVSIWTSVNQRIEAGSWVEWLERHLLDQDRRR